MELNKKGIRTKKDMLNVSNKLFGRITKSEKAKLHNTVEQAQNIYLHNTVVEKTLFDAEVKRSQALELIRKFQNH